MRNRHPVAGSTMHSTTRYTRSATDGRPRRQPARLGDPVELEEELAEPGESPLAELLAPGGLELGNRLPDDEDRGGAPPGEDDPPGAEIVGNGLSGEIPEAFEL